MVTHLIGCTAIHFIGISVNKVLPNTDEKTFDVFIVDIFSVSFKLH